MSLTSEPVNGLTTSTAFSEMKTVRSIGELHAVLKELNDNNVRIGFVPTMGALHSGHATLIRTSAAENTLTVVSIFVNPTQFNVQSDFDKYPRTLDEDLSIAELNGANIVLVPTADEMYPKDFRTFIEPGGTADPMEGQCRPGHFRGVATIVVKLLNIVSPDVAYFGKKDFQQLAVIKETVNQLNMKVEITGVDTVREKDGLALSSRNVRLSDGAREQAPVIYRALQRVRQRFLDGERNRSSLEDIAREELATSPLCQVEYATICDASTLQISEVVSDTSVLCIAAWFDDVRLIDNIELQAFTGER